MNSSIRPGHYGTDPRTGKFRTESKKEKEKDMACGYNTDPAKLPADHLKHPQIKKSSGKKKDKKK